MISNAFPIPQEADTLIKENYKAPKTDLEKQLANLWAEFLQIEKVSIDANFFEIGGNSIKAFQLLTLINAELHTDLKIISFFQYP